MKAWTLTEQDISQELNIAKEMVLSELARDGIITDEQADHKCKEYLFVCMTPMTMGNFWKRLCKTPEETRRLLTKITAHTQEALSK